MRRLRLKKKWKVLLCVLVFGGTFFVYKGKSSNALEDDSTETVVRTNRVTIEESKANEEVIEEEPVVEEEVIDTTIRETAEVGFFQVVEGNFSVSLKGTKHGSGGYQFYMDEDIDATISGDYLEGNIYIIKHGSEIKSSYGYGEYLKETIFNNSVFFINYEEGHSGYYDAVFVSNDQVLGYVTFEIVV